MFLSLLNHLQVSDIWAKVPAYSLLQRDAEHHFDLSVFIGVILTEFLAF